MNKNDISNGGLGFFTILGLIFIVLKLCGVINWSWWLVLLPLYGGVVLFAILCLIFFICVLVGTFIVGAIQNESLRRKRR